MSERTVELERRGAAAWVWMNRPEVHNALNEELIAELTQAFHALGQDAGVRAIVLTGRGRSFCAGADADSMRRQGEMSPHENLENARALAEFFRVIAFCAKPTIARVNGAAIGGGLGLVCACDIAVAVREAKFATSEVRLGLIPATIGPYVVRAIGERWAKRLFQTAERITAAQAERIGLVHEAVEPEALDARIETIVNDLAAGAPAAQSAAKELIDAVAGRPITPELIEDTAMRIATIRAKEEARQGLSAFLEKRPAAWTRANKSNDV
ncbi:MAG TPA: enoyl-CoA hydratase/isomerase family protein [Terracidiphilus sp.]|jgi:methylglutaconyl-CoA hydratase|nr:enoyl-CoA hydratase/isomerase family protein [Terracidiphilus sp.]